MTSEGKTYEKADTYRQADYWARRELERRDRVAEFLADPETPDEFTATFQVWATVTYRDGKPTEVHVTRQVDHDFLDAIEVEGVGAYQPELQYAADDDGEEFVEVPAVLERCHQMVVDAEWPETYEQSLSLWTFGD